MSDGRGSGYPPGGLRLDELARDLPMRSQVAGDAGVRVTGVRHDSRAVERGDLFVARRGEKVDGARFVGDALARGAAAVLAAPGVLDAKALGVPVVMVDDPAAALGFVASAVYGHPSFALEVVGITGTNGKTTTAHLTRAAVDGALGAPLCGVLGTVGHIYGDWRVPAEHTTPEADEVARVMAEMRARGATHVAMEVSSHALDLGRVRGVHVRVAALTNLTQDHLDFHGSMEAYGESKARLFTELGPGAAVVNVDDAFGRSLVSRIKAPLTRVSARVGADADVAPREARLGPAGTTAVIRTPSGDVRLTSRLVGAHNLENLLLALGIAHALDLDLSRAADALAREPGAPGRFERCDGEDDDITVLVDYAHTPDALARALDAVRAAFSSEPETTARVWCVFGCGGDRDPTKRGPMGEAVARRADVTVVTSDNPRGEDPRAIADAVVAGVRSAGKEPVVELDRRKAIDLAVRSSSRGDAVLIAGKGHEDYQIIGMTKHPFDDRIEARTALAARRLQGHRRAGKGEGG
ncbi:MAG TPA: UDP-N-acetylmuramoyl-L-alanyl-D-glutamate--2,6-diaminopimelate ligase [Polyangiaceae bacterium]|jgi:UDP-N-acetylmuramoyl-L-alanyl-D-glutamate--2,6-diaminopimelate ligase|nr:UDP-N-acetylmuramoyl-L-alanyl-D-glutamate--2,6-diaminopimelate ligase [Polyangiaceae bacterium]